MAIEGFYLDGNTSNRVNARLEVYQEAKELVLHLIDDNGHRQTMPVQFDKIKITSRLGNTPREISLLDDQLFITDDNNAVDQLIECFTGSKSHSFLHKLETNLPLISLYTALIIAFIIGFSLYGVPAISKSIAFNLPDSLIENQGSSIAILDKTMFEPTQLDITRRNEIRQFFMPYLDDHKDLKPRLEFRSGMRANALALPGGYIVFTDDFVNLAKSDEELLAVLFHELGHLKQRHITRRMIQASIVTLLVVFITGDVETFDLITGLPTLVLDLSYSRDFENEADDYALEQLQHYNIPLESFALIMQRLDDYYTKQAVDDQSSKDAAQADKKTLPDFLSTHPATKERIRLVEKFKKLHADDLP